MLSSDSSILSKPDSPPAQFPARESGFAKLTETVDQEVNGLTSTTVHISLSRITEYLEKGPTKSRCVSSCNQAALSVHDNRARGHVFSATS